MFVTIGEKMATGISAVIRFFLTGNPPTSVMGLKMNDLQAENEGNLTL
mgnify:CR=1 FL=1